MAERERRGSDRAQRQPNHTISRTNHRTPQGSKQRNTHTHTKKSHRGVEEGKGAEKEPVAKRVDGVTTFHVSDLARHPCRRTKLFAKISTQRRTSTPQNAGAVRRPFTGATSNSQVLMQRGNTTSAAAYNTERGHYSALSTSFSFCPPPLHTHTYPHALQYEPRLAVVPSECQHA